MSTNTLNITATDNQLLIIAYQFNASWEIGTIFSGGGNTVDVTIPIRSGIYQGQIKLNGVRDPLSGNYPIYLARGDYRLALIGIKWGGGTSFNVEFDGQTLSGPGGNPGNGVVWTPSPIKFTV